MIATMEHLGVGIYSPAEAAFYARVAPRTLTRWVFGDSDGRPVIDRQLSDSGDKAVSFLDFVQALAIREVRQRYQLPLARIREGVEAARKIYGLDYPLAHKHRIFLFSDQQGEGHGEMVIKLERIEEGLGDRYVQLTGRDKGNRMLKQVVETFLNDLKFDPVTGLAERYTPISIDTAKVVLDPRRRFGEPIVEPNGYTVEALWHATNTEGGMEAAADAFGVTLPEVKIANKYYDMLDVNIRGIDRRSVAV